MFVTTEHVHSVDYSEYLGPKYQTTAPLPSKVSTIISNHTSALDFVILMMSEFKPAFLAKKPFRRIPIFGVLC